MSKTTTTLYIDEELLKTAKDLGINLSKTFTSALKIQMGLPAQKAALEEELLKNKSKISMIQAKLEEMGKLELKENKEAKEKDYGEQVVKLKHYKKKMIEGKINVNTYNKMLRQVAEYFNRSVSDVVKDVDFATFEFANQGAEE